MKKQCFSCQRTASNSLKLELELHKRKFEQTGKVYWFYKENKEETTKIANNESFNKILGQIKDNDGAEWCHIAEFGNAINDNVHKNNSNKKSKTSTPKSKPKATRRSLEKDL